MPLGGRPARQAVPVVSCGTFWFGLVCVGDYSRCAKRCAKRCAMRTMLLGAPSTHAARCSASANPMEQEGIEGGCMYMFSELQCRRFLIGQKKGMVSPSSVVPCSRNFSCHGASCRPNAMPVLPARDFLASVNGKRFVFLGDSVIMQLECDFRQMLANAGEKLTFTCGEGGYEYSGPGSFRVSVRAVETGCPRRCRPSAKLARKYLSSATHAIFNIGSHYDSSGRSLGGGRTKAPLRPALEEWVRTELRALKATIVFLSQPMPHFATASGAYSPAGLSRRDCVRHLPPSALPSAEVLMRQAASNLTHLRGPRASATSEASGARGAGGGAVFYVDVLGMSDQPRLHPGRGDCRHWCQECSMLHAWNSLIASTIAET